MASKTVTINTGQGERKETKFDLEPLSLNSSVQRGGTWNVFAAATPKTNAALQLSEALKNLPSVAKQYSDIQQTAGQERAGLISGQNAEEELIRLQKEEPDTFRNFMSNKAYKDSLMEKHIRTQMVPNTLKKLSNSANARLFKTQKEFDENSQTILSSSWDSFADSVGEEVANSVEGRTIWNNLTDEMTTNAQLAYFESQDAVALENDVEALEHRVSSLLSPTDMDGNARDVNVTDLSELTLTAIPELVTKHGQTRAQATGLLRKIMATTLETQFHKGNNLQVLDMAEALFNTKSVDGVSIYEDNSESALKINRIVKSARNEIEKLEDEENDIEQSVINESVGLAVKAIGNFNNGRRWASFTPNKQQITLQYFQSLDPTYTMEKLQEKMAPTDETDAGGGLETLKFIQDDILVNGSDRAQSIIKRTVTATNRAVNIANQLKPPPSAVRAEKDQQAHVDRLKSIKINDPDYTLEMYLEEHNIQSFTALDTANEKLQGVTDVMQSSVYKGIGDSVRENVDSIFSTLEINQNLGNVTTANATLMIGTMTEQIQAVMKLESGDKTLLPDEYQKRFDELLLNAKKSAEYMLRATEGSDILGEDKKKFDPATGQQELTHNVKYSDSMHLISPSVSEYFMGSRGAVVLAGETREVEAPFKTNASSFKEVKEERKNKGFGVFTLYNTVQEKWSTEEVNADRAEMRSRIQKGTDEKTNTRDYKDALGYSLHLHGGDFVDNPTQTLDDLETAGLDALDVKLFKEQIEIRELGETMFDAVQKLISLENLTQEETQLLDYGRRLGLVVDGDLSLENFSSREHFFRTAQYNFF